MHMPCLPARQPCAPSSSSSRHRWVARAAPRMRNKRATASAQYFDDPPPTITSMQNPMVKHCVKLRSSSKYRAEHGAALLAGSDLLAEVAGRAHFLTLFVLEGEAEEGPAAAHLPPGVSPERTVTVSEGVMRRITGLESVARGAVAAEVELPRPADLLAVPTLDRLLALDGLQDPGNLGTLLRSAAALGWQAAYLLPGCADPFSDKALRASRGAAFQLPMARGSAEEWAALAAHHGMACLAAESGGANQQQQRRQQQRQPAGAGRGPAPGVGSDSSEAQRQALLAARLCLVLGSEGQGVSAAVRAHARPVTIPQAGGMESLNVSSAGAILLFLLGSGAAPAFLQQLLQEL